MICFNPWEPEIIGKLYFCKGNNLNGIISLLRKRHQGLHGEGKKYDSFHGSRLFIKPYLQLTPSLPRLAG
jgi:hypothetical protein